MVSGQGHRILIITSDLPKGEVVARFLHSNGFGVSTAPDARIAVDKFAADPADIVIVDQLRGATQTLSAMRKLRGLNGLGERVPVVLADSPEWDDTMISAAQDIGVSQFVYDPFGDLDMLLEIVRDTLGVEVVSQAASTTTSSVPEDGLGEYVHIPSSTTPIEAIFPNKPAVTPPLASTAEMFRPLPDGVEVSPDSPRPSQAFSAEMDGGALEENSIAELLARYCAKRLTGKLDIVCEGVSKSIYFKKGAPICVDSCLPEETLGAFLEKMGRLTAEQRSIAEAQQSDQGGLQGQILLEKGWVGPNELFQYLTEHQTEKVISCFGWSSGSFTFSEGQEPEGSAVPMKLDLPRLLLDGIKRHYDFKKLYQLMEIADDSIVGALPDGPISVEQLKLNPAEARLHDLARRGMAVGELLSLCTINLTEALQTLYGLRLLGMITFSGGQKTMGLGRTVSAGASVSRTGSRRSSVARSAVRRSSVTEARPSSVGRDSTEDVFRTSAVYERSSDTPRQSAAPGHYSSAPASAEDQAALERQKISEIEELKAADYFALLGVGRNEQTSKIHQALQQRAKRYHPDALLNYSIEVQAKGAQMLKRFVKAYEVLSDAAKRAEYVETLENSEYIRSSSIPASPRPQAESNGEGSSEIDVLRGRAKELFLKAQEAMKIERYQLAISRLEQANEKQGGNVRILSWLGWAVYNANPDDKTHAEYYLVEARRAAPNNPEPYLFMARIRAVEGSVEQALEFYEQASKTDPTDLDIAREAHMFRAKMKEMASKQSKKRRSKAPKKRASQTAGPRNGGAEPKSILDADVGSIFKKIFTK